MATVTRSHTFTSGEILTAGNLNGELDGILSTINGDIDEANVDTSAIPTLTAVQTLTNKTLTSPKIGTNILDTNGNELITLTATGSAVNEVTLANAATGNAPTLTASGGDTNVDLALAGKGSGKVIVTGDLQISGNDLFMATNTSGHLLIGDGTNYNPTALTGDVSVNGSGVTAIGSGVIVNADVNASAAIAQSKLSLAITTSEVAAATLVIESEGIGSNDNDTTIPTSAAVKDYVDTNVTAQDFDFTTTSGSGAVDLDSQALAFTPGEGIDITHSSQAITFAAEDATDANKGVASFASADFSVSSGAVSLVDLTTSHIAAGTLVIESEGIGSNDNDTTVPTSAAVKDYVDTNVTAQDLDFSTSTGNGAVDLDSQALAFTPGEGVDITHSGQAVTIAGEDATTSNKGIASFASADFGVSSGAVSLVDLTVSHLAAATLVIESEGISGNDNDTTLPTSAAVRDYVDTRILTEDTIAELNDTDIGTLAAGNLLVYDGSNSWDNKVVGGDAAMAANGALTLVATNTNLTTLANVTTVGTIGTGTWQGTAVGLAYGGTGLVGATDGKIVIADGNGAPVLLDVGSSTAITTLGTVTTGAWAATDVAVAHGGTGASNASTARTNLGVAIGSNVQAYDAGLASIAGLTTAANKMIYTTGSDTYAVTDLSEFAIEILNDADAAAVRATIGAGSSSASQFSDLADVGVTTNDAGRLMVADGDSWESVVVNGDITLAADGAMTIKANSVALATDTTGNYVATVADAGNSHITVANSGAENAGVTLNITDNAVGLAQMAGLARGKIIYGDASGNPAALSAGSNTHVLTSNGTDISWQAATGGGSSGHTIQEEGSGLTARANLNFVGAAVTATDNGSDTTIVTIGAENATLPFTNSNGGSDPIALASVAVGQDLVSDTTPQLGGDLDINGNDIVSDSGNENINITPHGTGSVVISKADINGGAIDGTIIGAASTAAISGTTGTFSGAVSGATLAGTVSTAAQNSITSASSLATVGTIGTGTWEATDIAVAHGGTGASTFAANGILLGNGTSAIAASAELTFDGTDLAIGNAAPSSYISSVHGLVIGDTSDATSEIILVTANDGTGALNFTDTTSTTDHFGWLRFDHSGTNHMELGVHQGTHTYFMPGPYAVMGGTDTTNGYMNIGWTLQQQAYDNEILSFKSTDVCHTMTDNQEEDTYGTFTKYAGSGASAGGLAIFGISEGDSGIFLKGQATTKNTTRSTSAFAPVYFAGAGKVGAGSSSIGADGNICVIATGANLARFIFDEEGSAHADVEWTTFSDTRLKKNVVDCPYGLAEVLQLEPKAFDKHGGMIDEDDNVVLEDTPRRMIGFLAQDVKALMPELVKEVDTSKSFYSLNDGKLVAVLVNAIKELSDKLEAN